MKKFLLGIIFLMITFNSHAQSSWVYVATTTKGDDYFVDKASAQRQGDSITFWYRGNYKQRNRFGDLSEKVQTTINCRTRDSIMRFTMFYDDVDNNGQLTTMGKASGSWQPIAPDTLHWDIYKVVCK